MMTIIFSGLSQNCCQSPEIDESIISIDATFFTFLSLPLSKSGNSIKKEEVEILGQISFIQCNLSPEASPDKYCKCHPLHESAYQNHIKDSVDEDLSTRSP